MLLLLAGVLLLVSILILFVRKSYQSLFLSGMCFALTIYLCGILVFIAKKGGYSREIIQFLFFSPQLRNWVQYLLLSLNQIGYLIAIGRYLFPLFLLELALSYSMIPFLRAHRRIRFYIIALPALSLVVYYPTVYRQIVDFWPRSQNFLVQVSYFWVMAYVVLAILLLVYEYLSIKLRFCRRPFASIVVCMTALSVLYILYCGQDPGQVYRFYSYDYIWNKGIGYLQFAPTVSGYYLLVLVNLIGGTLGFTSLVRYTHVEYQTGQDDVVLERKFDTVRTGASTFVHSIKNQLLANRVIHKRIEAELSSDAADMQRLSDLFSKLRENNEFLISRSEELYGTVKNQSVRLVPIQLEELAQAALERFFSKYPEGLVAAPVIPPIEILADKGYFSEAVYNLLINGWEANIAAGKRETPLRLIGHEERLYTVLEISDDGVGISPDAQKHIFDPFYSSKNSNHNWGMGLYHVRAIVKSHFGSLRVESKPEQGTSIFILLPKYGEKNLPEVPQ